LIFYPPIGKGTDNIEKDARNERSKYFEIIMKQRYDARDNGIEKKRTSISAEEMSDNLGEILAEEGSKLPLSKSFSLHLRQAQHVKS